MTKQTLLVVLLLSSFFLPIFLYGQECVLPSCKDLSAYVFNDRFCCQREGNKRLDCKAYYADGSPNCDKPFQEILLDYYDLASHGPLNPLQEARAQAAKEKRKPGNLITVYQCPNQNAAMSVLYDSYTVGIITHLFHVNSETLLMLYTWLPYNLPTNSPLIAQTMQALETYLCYSFDPKKFLDTLEAPAFSFPDRRAESAPVKKESEPVKQAEPEPAITSVPKKATTPPIAKPLDQPKQPQEEPALAMNPIKKPTPPPHRNPLYLKEAEPADLPTSQAPQTDMFRLADVVFQAAYSPVPEVRHFESTNKLVDLKINFKTGDKTAFQNKLKQTFAGMRFKETQCPNQNMLLEFLVGSSYRAFLLHPSAIVSWEEPAYANALLNTPSENQKRRELCALNPTQFWE